MPISIEKKNTTLMNSLQANKTFEAIQTDILHRLKLDTKNEQKDKLHCMKMY